MTRLILLLSTFFALSSCSKSEPAEPAGSANFSVYFVQQYAFDVFGNTYAYYKDYMLLKDGTILSDVKQAYQDVDIEQFKRDNPSKWGSWEKQDGKILVRINNKESVWESWHEGYPASKDEKLNGTYRSLFSAVVQNAQHLSFAADGTYTFRDNRQAEVQSGTYRLEGFGLYLNPANGAPQSFSFLFMPSNGKKDSKGLIVGGDNWTLEQ